MDNKIPYKNLMEAYVILVNVIEKKMLNVGTSLSVY